MSRRVLGYLAFAGLATGAYFRVPEDLLVPLYNGITISAVVVMFLGIWRRRPEPLGAWLFLGLGVMLLAAGEIVFGESQAVPSPADMLFMSAYPLLALGFVGLAPWSPMKRRGTSFVVAAAITGTIVVIGWAFLVLPHTPGADLDVAARIVALAYPLMDLVLIALVLRAAARGFTDYAMHALGVGLVLMIVADSAYALSFNFGNDYVLGQGIDALWLMSYALIGASTLIVRTTIEPPFVIDPARDRRATSVQTHAGGVGTMVREHTVRELTTATAHAIVNQDLRFGVVIGWSGRMLVGIGACAMFLATSWLAADVAFLAGAMSITGILMWVVSART